MSKVYEFLKTIQANGEISSDEVPLIRQKLSEDGQLDISDVRLLVELYCETADRCPEFDSLFFAVLEKVFMEDGQIQPSEEYYLLKMLYSDRQVREPEREFLRRLRKQLPQRTASFEALFETAMGESASSCGVGGRRS